MFMLDDEQAAAHEAGLKSDEWHADREEEQRIRAVRAETALSETRAALDEVVRHSRELIDQTSSDCSEQTQAILDLEAAITRAQALKEKPGITLDEAVDEIGKLADRMETDNG